MSRAQENQTKRKTACQQKSDRLAASDQAAKKSRRVIYMAFRKRFGKAWKLRTIHGKGEVFVKVSQDLVGGAITFGAPYSIRGTTPALARFWADAAARYIARRCAT